MNTEFLSYFKKFKILDLTDLKNLYSAVSIKKYKAGDTVLNEGDISYNTFVVLRGMLRSYILKSNGTETTVLLCSEGMAAGSSRTFVKDLPSIETIEVLEDALVMVVDTQKLDEICKKHPRIKLVQYNHLKRNFGDAVERVEFLSVLSPLERYLHLLENHPEFIRRVPQKYLASYMGITTESLSRVKARIANRGL